VVGGGYVNVRALVASPLIVLMLFGTRLLTVSNYNTDTAVTIFRLGGVTDTSVGTVLPLLPLLLPTVFLVLLVLRQWLAAGVAVVCSLLVAIHPKLLPSAAGGVFPHVWADVQRDRSATWRLITKAGVVASGARTQTPSRFGGSVAGFFSRDVWAFFWHQPVLISAVVVTFVVVVRGVRVNMATGEVGFGNMEGRRAWRLVKALFFSMVVVLGFHAASAVYPIPPRDSGIWSESLHRMWMPPERLILTGGKPLVAYRLGVKDDWEVLLIDTTREIQYVKKGQIATRSPCALTPPANRSPFWGPTKLILEDYPPCYPSATTKA
jgi:hypothetical protein